MAEVFVIWLKLVAVAMSAPLAWWLAFRADEWMTERRLAKRLGEFRAPKPEDVQ